MAYATDQKSFLCFRDLVRQEGNIYDHSLEQALCQADFFHEYGLRLFRRADLTRLQPLSTGAPAGSALKAEDLEGRRVYLLCRGDKALVAFETFQETEEHRFSASPWGLTALKLQRVAEESELMVLERAVRLALQEDGRRWGFPMEPADAKTWPCLVREGLVERHRREDGRLFWDVSPAGREQGLCWGWSAEDGKLREGPFWSGKARKRPEWAWSELRGRRRPLAARLWELETGWHIRQSVERFARAELGEYMKRCPKELEELEEKLGVGPETPFHQVAALIQQRLLDTEEETHDEGVDLMCLLASPIASQ